MQLIEPDTRYTQEVFELIQRNMEEFSKRMPWPRFSGSLQTPSTFSRTPRQVIRPAPHWSS